MLYTFLKRLRRRLKSLVAVVRRRLVYEFSCSFLIKNCQTLKKRRSRFVEDVCRLKISEGRRHYFHRFEVDSDPFCRAAKLYLDSGNKDLCLKSLSEFYQNFQPDSASQLFGLPAADLRCGVMKYPIWSVPFPWDQLTIAQQYRIIEERLLEDSGNRCRANEGNPSMGPLTPKRLNVETERICSLVDSIQEEGIRHKYQDPVIVDLLFNQHGACRWLVKSGNHRCPILAILDYSEVVGVVKNVISIEDVRTWPNVVNGLFSVEGATKIFHRVFDADSPVPE